MRDSAGAGAGFDADRPPERYQFACCRQVAGNFIAKEVMSTRRERQCGCRLSGAAGSYKDGSFAIDAESGGMKEDRIRAKSQQTPEQVPHNAEAPPVIEGKQAVSSPKSEGRDGRTTKCDAFPSRLLGGEHLKVSVIELYSEIELAGVNRGIAAPRHSKPPEIGARAGANIHVHVGRAGKAPRTGSRAAEHRKELGKERLIVALRSNATISDHSRGCEHPGRLVLLKSREQAVERAVSPGRHFLKRA